ncbi:GntR family transcriptional regulator [Micropruina glycogenica]|uniref:Transcriptional regulator n=1 Tax=Micropruina glycogenica TaxID=75385 RepID=A0A2N9JJW7_9ACTN|nr:GntR family transcriptional regulator [Micropruina glycogenica]SPD88344.1 Transcriptional regulator [Micropruina glycogenica]
MTLNRDSAVPLYLQLADELRQKILSGEWQPEQRIPSENELNQIYSISRMTIRQVLGKLVDEGLVFRVHGKGTFVAQRKIATRSPSYYGVREQLEAQGYSTRTATLVSEVVEADDRLARKLNVPLGTPLSMVERLRFAEDAPISLHKSYVPVPLAPGLLEHDLAQRQLCQVLAQDYGLDMVYVHETLESLTPTAHELTMLDVSRGTSLLLLEQRISDRSRRLFEYTRIKFRGDRVRLEFDYDLSEAQAPATGRQLAFG